MHVDGLQLKRKRQSQCINARNYFVKRVHWRDMNCELTVRPRYDQIPFRSPPSCSHQIQPAERSAELASAFGTDADIDRASGYRPGVRGDHALPQAPLSWSPRAPA